MRIRKRSIAALSLSLSPSSCRKPEVSSSTGEEEQMIKEKQFLLPLVAAAMDVQARAHAHFGEQDGHAITEIHSRPLHKWKNALHRCTTESEAFQAGGEGDKSYYRWDGIMRKTGGDKFGLVTSEGCAKGCTPSSLDGERELPKSSGCEKKASDVGVGAAMKKQRSKSDCTKKSHTNEEWKISPKMKGNEDKSDEDNKNLHAGSQCRRRNGRGWRCSERTLVGYYLCEHHLGKGRLKSINNSTGAVVVKNDKGTKFKDLHLINSAASASAFAL